MEQKGSLSISITDLFIKLLSLFAIYLIATELLLPMFFPKKSGCGCNKRKSLEDGTRKAPSSLVSNGIVTPKGKACVAVGLCSEEMFDVPIAPHKWRTEVMLNAEKIFGKAKTEKSKPKNKGKK